MASVIGDSFRGKSGEVFFEELEKVSVVCLYFSANWCPPCRTFNPVLVDFYREVNFPDKRLEIILVSSDKDEGGYNEHMSALPWLSIPFTDVRNQPIKRQFKITGIPELLVLNRDGTIAHSGARADVLKEGSACFDRWLTLVT